MSIIDKIITLLEENNRTQKELTDFLGLDKSTFSAWKNGKSQSYNKYLSKIAEFFNVSTDYLLGNETPQEPSDKTEREVKLIARKTKDLPEEDREALLELLNSTVDTFLKAKGIKND